MNRKKRSLEQLRQISAHLHYEVEMLSSAARGLASGIASGSAMNNALLESFAIHLRNLVEFLWPEKPKNDHVIAQDFFPLADDWKKLCPPIPKEVREARIRAAKEAAHLTYARLLVVPDKKAWAYVSLMNEIMKTFKLFLQHVPKETLDSKWK